MSYQVLARKYRPGTFTELVGQEHVSRALTHALDQDRLHHAYLFTGTRGVGKTTIARILSRCLNCEQGVSSQPCGVCGSCQEISEGRFVDLIEVDAASRTKVEDTRELLENVQYAPTRGRYKVYLIDEVHMLSGSSFNALLKTLEEPPPHVKFLLATTDPQKVPVTVLSRCLQFNLKALPAEHIAQHLKALLEKEMIPFEEPGLLALGRAARGSMRDALSLTDQAIAFCGDKLAAEAVNTMLGNVDRAHVHQLAETLASGDPARLLQSLDQICEQSPDEKALLEALTSLLHRLAVAQALPARETDESLVSLAARFQAEQIQLYYDVAVRGCRDLPFAPEPRAALEMTLLRMLLFRPEGVVVASTSGGPTAKKYPEPPSSASTVASSATQTSHSARSATRQDVVANTRSVKSDVATTRVSVSDDPGTTTAASSEISSEKTAEKSVSSVTPVSDVKSESSSQQTTMPMPATVVAAEQDRWWDQLVDRLSLEGSVRNLARNCQLLSRKDSQWVLGLHKSHQLLTNADRQNKLQQQIDDYLGGNIRLDIQLVEKAGDTPDQLAARRREMALEEARQSLTGHPVVLELASRFNGRLDESGIEPSDVLIEQKVKEHGL